MTGGEDGARAMAGEGTEMTGSCSTLRGAERAAADCDRWPRTGFCGVEGCDVGGRGFGAAVEACVDARAAWAAEAAGVLYCRAAAKGASLAAEARLGGMG